MKLVIIHASRRKGGSTDSMAKSLAEGAREAGHEVFTFEAAYKQVGGCWGCEACGCGKNPCIQKDDMHELYGPLQEADVIVFAMPVYYYSMTGQMKCVIDRVYGIHSIVQHSPKKTVLLTACADTTKESVKNVVAEYETFVTYMGWTDVGQIAGLGLWGKGDVQNSPYLKEAYDLGKSL